MMTIEKRRAVGMRGVERGASTEGPGDVPDK